MNEAEATATEMVDLSRCGAINHDGVVPVVYEVIVGRITQLVNQHDALLSEVAQLRAEALRGICVYCGYIEQYESLEQKASAEGNAMRVAHIKQCAARPELRLIAFSEELIEQVAQLREVLGAITMLLLQKQFDEAREIALTTEIESLDGKPVAALNRR